MPAIVPCEAPLGWNAIYVDATARGQSIETECGPSPRAQQESQWRQAQVAISVLTGLQHDYRLAEELSSVLVLILGPQFGAALSLDLLVSLRSRLFKPI